jgi:hypothetical protein
VLRDFQYNPATSQIVEVLQRFSLDFKSEKSSLDVLRFEVISPDSFMWKLLLGNAVYYLYAEDYVSGMDYIKDVFNDYLESDKWNFVIPQQILLFESSSPVEHANVYQKPERADELMRYAVDSGHDFVFLVKTFENPHDAHFTKKLKSIT